MVKVNYRSLFILACVVASIIVIFLVAMGGKPACIKGTAGRSTLPRGWYKNKHPWKKNTWCRYAGSGSDTELLESGAFFCSTPKNGFEKISKITPDSPHDLEPVPLKC